MLRGAENWTKLSRKKFQTSSCSPSKLQRKMFLDAVIQFLSRVQIHKEIRCPWRGNLNTNTHFISTHQVWKLRFYFVVSTCLRSVCCGISISSICCSWAWTIKASLMSSEVQRSKGTGTTWSGGDDGIKVDSCRKSSWSQMLPIESSNSGDKENLSGRLLKHVGRLVISDGEEVWRPLLAPCGAIQMKGKNKIQIKFRLFKSFEF